MVRQVKPTIMSALGVMIGAIIIVTWSCSKPSGQYGFLSPDKRYEATRVKTSTGIHYQLKGVDIGRVVLVTHAKYDTYNDVKAGIFSADSRKFAAAYHYGHKGSCTWIGIWDIETRALLRSVEKPDWIVDISWVFTHIGEEPTCS